MRERLIAANNTDPQGKDSNPEIIAKIFNPYGPGRWYLIDMEKDGRAFGLCCLSDPELGYVDVNELDGMLVDVLGTKLPLERDLHWEGKLEDAKKELQQLGFY